MVTLNLIATASMVSYFGLAMASILVVVVLQDMFSNNQTFNIDL